MPSSTHAGTGWQPENASCVALGEPLEALLPLGAKAGSLSQELVALTGAGFLKEQSQGEEGRRGGKQ